MLKSDMRKIVLAPDLPERNNCAGCGVSVCKKNKILKKLYRTGILAS